MNAHRMRVVGLLFGLAALVAVIVPTAARADAVTDCNAIASRAIMTTAGQPPHAAVLSLAIVQAEVGERAP